jgi:hypothetical protein
MSVQALKQGNTVGLDIFFICFNYSWLFALEASYESTF